MICGFAVELYLWRYTSVPWTWWVMIGTTMTFVIGYGISVILGTPQERKVSHFARQKS